MISKLTNTKQPGVFFLPAGVVYEQIKNVLVDGMAISHGEYKKCFIGYIQVLCYHPLKHERVEVIYE